MFPNAQDPSLPFEVINIRPDQKELYQSLDQQDFLEKLPVTWDEDGNSIAGVLYTDLEQFKMVMAVIYEHHTNDKDHNPFVIVKRRLLKLYVRQGPYEEASVTTGQFRLEKEDPYSIFNSLKIGEHDEDIPYLGIYPNLWSTILHRLNTHVITAKVEVGNERIC